MKKSVLSTLSILILCWGVAMVFTSQARASKSWGSIQFLNGESDANQFFAVGTAGEDFNIVSDSQVHTFNFPDATGGTRGLLTPADWLRFDEAANLADNPVFSAAISGPSFWLSSTSSPLVIAPTFQTYADYSGANESGPGLFIKRTIANEASDNEHGVVDASQFGRAGKAYASFDSQPVFTGTNNYDHVSNFQARALMNSSGTLSNYYGFFNFPTTSQGTVTNMYAFYASVGNTVPGSIINRYAFVSETNAGPVGIGTITPTHRLTIGANETPVSTASIFGAYNGGNSHGIFRDTVNDIELSFGTDGTGGFLNMNTNHQLSFNANSATRLTLSSSGVRFNGYGAGTLNTDGSGNVTASSDARLKFNRGRFTRGLEALRRIDPILYSWRPMSGMETHGIYAGVMAQNIQQAIPEAVSADANGYLSLQDRPMILTLVNAVKELDIEIRSLRAEIKRLKRSRIR